MEEQITELLSNISILPEFKDWAIEILKREHAAEVFSREDIQRAHEKSLSDVQRKLDVLLDMRLNGDIDNATYLSKKDSLQADRINAERRLKTTFQRADNWLETAEKVFEFACHARELFEKGDLRVKKEILMALGSNFVMKDGKLMITCHSWLLPIEKDYHSIEAEYLGFEPTERLIAIDKNGVPRPFFQKWSG